MRSLMLLALIFMATTYIGIACSKVPLELQPTQSLFSITTEGELCVPPPVEVGKYSRILFIMDVSGSNNQTDPGKVRRINGIQSIFQEFSSNPDIEWGLIVFSGGIIQSLVQVPNGNVIRNFAPASDFLTAINQFQQTPDANATPYLGALNQARLAIQNELNWANQTGQIDELYFYVIFASDGIPTDSQPNQVFAAVNDLVNLTRGRITLSTIYYDVSGPNPTANNLMMEMARLGNGLFQDASNGQPLDLRPLLGTTGRGQIPYMIKHFFVYNLNSTICQNGEIGVDSDADGLCDADERTFNDLYADLLQGKRFDPENAYSIDRRFKDSIMYEHLIRGATLPQCEINEQLEWDKDHDLLNPCEEQFMRNSNPTGANPNWDAHLQQNQNGTFDDYFDSDGDGMLDGLEWLFFRNRSYALSYRMAFYQINGRTLYDYFRQHQSYLKPQSSPPYNVQVRFIRRNELGLNCYQIDQEFLPLYVTAANVNINHPELTHGPGENVILVYYIANLESDPDGPGVLRYAYFKQHVSQINQKQNLTNLPYKEYKSPRRFLNQP